MSLVNDVRAWLAPGGALAARWPGYEDRPAQAALAGDIAATLERGGVLLAEAPTGIGKSLAYLLPGVLAARAGRGRVVVATCTRSLQDQLVERDLPALLRALGISLPVVRLKGKQNYLCPSALDLATAEGAEERATLEALRVWAAAESEGDLDRFIDGDAEAFRRIRPRVATDAAACTTATCGRGRECFWVRARRAAQSAPLVVVNHALLAISGEVDGLLPEFDVLFVDEAHRLEGVLLGQLECSVSRNRFEEILRLVGSGRRGTGGLLARLRGYALPLFARGASPAAAEEAGAELDELARRVPATREDAERLFAAVEPRGERHALYGARERYRTAAELFGRDLEPLEAALGDCTRLAALLKRCAERTGNAGPAGDELASELEEVAGRFTQLERDLQRVALASERDWVYWRSATARGVELHGSPISVGEHARRLVLGRARAAVLTSATLSAAGDFVFLAARLGLGEEQGLPYETRSVPSPFPLERQMKVLVLDSGDEEAFAVAELVRALAPAGRNQLVLFTAHDRLRRARARLEGQLAPGTLIAQEWDGAASVVAERFRIARGAVLLGVQSLWEGVDFPGESLEILVIAKLPFAVPDDPLVEARGERLKDRGLAPFQHDVLPEAVLRFRQGVGRLIRRGDDRGVLVVCDPRLLRASYRRAFLAALPVAPVAFRDPGALAREAEAFLAAPRDEVEEGV